MSPKKINFEEKQYFNQIWIRIGQYALISFALFLVYKQLIMGEPIGNNPASDELVYFLVVVLFATAWWFQALHMHTLINNEGIKIKFKPLMFQSRKFKWNEIYSAKIRKYNPIYEYGGWGIRLGLFGKGRAYNVKGNIGLQLELTNGKKILIGTQEKEELSKHFEIQE